jgi:uncharacterized protein
VPGPALWRSNAASVPDAPAGVVYVDTSALVKLLVHEPETEALEEALQGLGDLATSAITVIELTRTVARTRAEASADVADQYAILSLMASLAEMPLDDEVRSTAGSLTPPTLRTLDAIHLASAIALGENLAGMLVYGRRLQQSARMHGLTVMAPGQHSTAT